MKLNIKNMVCSRCLKVLRQELEQLGIKVSSIELGVLVIDETAGNHNEIMEKIESVLHTNKFEIIHSSEEVLVEKIKHFLLRKIEELPLDSTVNLSQTLSAEFNHEYKSLSKLFSHLENTTVEKYFINLKIEKVKQLIQLRQYTFSEIGHLLDYSSVNHLSRQFKEVTGESMTEYKNAELSNRRPYDEMS
ncbi:helix-turn-helix domain-containing protein [Kaistella sp. BT6-1-3]|uniref:Helix-turn-helix domain-containing protein n=1 Tax=Kaistella yananensis TaxID=2989820 RepID=A0ABT3JLW7_9FLAO|nr:helix-turn-helix domain-containing protein [Kaistella yananensis]MCW4451491.1 helix-turn-helix domain-containing protein [Kaistella yananensis]